MNPGIDLLRIFALLLVTWQHAASVIGAYEETRWLGISPGQLGVVVFCSISGHLAFIKQPDNLTGWIWKRLIRIYPAYWIVTIFAFALSFVFATKNISLGQFISQMLGTGYFTHGWNLVNVVSWFISLILLCYAIAAFAWWTKKPEAILASLIVAGTISCLLHAEVSLSRHLIAFGLAGYFSLHKNTSAALATGLFLVAIGFLHETQLFYAGFGILCITAINIIHLPDRKLIQNMSYYSYEYFLLHGIFLVGVSRFISSPWLMVAVSIMCSCAASIALNRITNATLQVAERSFQTKASDGR